MKKLFGCVCVCRVFLPVLLVLCTIAGVNANNIRVEGKTRVVSVAGDTAIIEVNLRWDNSWRDDFNWDAAWVFFKFKKRGLENPWQHVYLSSSGHVLSASAGNDGGGYAYMVGANGGKVNGLYVMRDGISEGNVSVRLRVKWPLAGSGLTSSDFGDALNGIYVAVHAIEMVYIPYGAYYLGDNYSNNCLTSNQELVNQGSYSASSIYSGFPAQNALPGYSGYWCSAGQGSEERWQIKFVRPYTITSFALGVYAQVQYGYLEGSHTGLNGDWVTLWSGGSNCFPVTSSYPFSNYLTVSSPGAYTYYRIRMKSGSYSGIYNISLKSQESPVVIDSEAAFALGIKGYNNSISLSASYPKGYAGFYVMKYETSQEQYVEFLNSLTLEQQKARVMNNDFAHMKRGDYVFGDLKNPSCRNGIVFVEQRKPNTPVVFGNNLNPNNDLFSTDDGQTLACNYMSVEDMIAYCSWSGLRPMSELEYEKACRRPYPQLPEQGEYAWNTNSGVNAVSSLGDLAYLGDEREQAISATKNVNSGMGNRINGPVRCGLFATSSTSQSQSGATYWGVMEMSGNLKELCMSVENPGFDGHIGTGVYNAACWNTAVGNYGVRGGGFNSTDDLLRTSDRTEAMNYFASITQRDSTVGFRGVYSLSGIQIDGGKIRASQDTVCPGADVDVNNLQVAFCPDFPNVRFQYNWYVKKPGEAQYSLIENETGENLTYEGLDNTTTAAVIFQFKRTGICAMGVAECETKVVVGPKATGKTYFPPSYNSTVGTQFDLSCTTSGNEQTEWVDPSGTPLTCGSIRVTTQTVPRTYRVYYKNQYGCKGEEQEVVVQGYPGLSSIPQHVKVYREQGATLDGIYMLDIDGAGGNAPMPVYCDMTIDGGNWMLVWKAAYNTYGTSSYSYDVGTLANLDFTDVAMAYLNPATMQKTNFTIMSGAQMVADFKAQHPFSYSARDVNVTAKIGTYTQSGVLFRYGWANFHFYIYEGWSTNASYGRIGLNWNQPSPYYNGYVKGAGNYCCVGYQKYDAQYCTNTRRFSLWVR